jgi:hypothetical protein
VPLTRRQFVLRSLGAVGASSAGVGLYTWRVEPHWLEIVHCDLALRNLPAALVGSTLVHVSDLHIGPQVDDAYVIRTFERIRALQPAFVVFSGDFITYRTVAQFAQLERVAAHVPLGRIGTFAALGNHDYGPGWRHPEIAERVASIVSAAGVTVLRNQSTVVSGLQIAGFDDLWAGRFEPEATIARLERGTATLALSHNPDTVDAPLWRGYEGWILAGHTHGGQCKPPFLPPPLLPVQNRRYTRGEFALSGNRRMYISRGVGHLLRVRFNVRPEVTVFRLGPG